MSKYKVLWDSSVYEHIRDWIETFKELPAGLPSGKGKKPLLYSVLVKLAEKNVSRNKIDFILNEDIERISRQVPSVLHPVHQFLTTSFSYGFVKMLIDTDIEYVPILWRVYFMEEEKSNIRMICYIVYELPEGRILEW
jgi:hypothetical protein